MYDVEVAFTDRDDVGASDAAWARCNLGLNTEDDPGIVVANRQAVARELGIELVACVNQVHGCEVFDADGACRWDEPDAVRPEADALVARQHGVGVAVLVADCIPVAIAAHGVAAVAHAGWRGLVGGVLEATVASVRAAAADGAGVAATIGPAIGPCCFEVGEEVAARFDRAAVVRIDRARKPHVDLRTEALGRLTALGVHVDVIDACTSCSDRHFSHRRDGGVTGRQAVVAWVGLP